MSAVWLAGAAATRPPLALAIAVVSGVTLAAGAAMPIGDWPLAAAAPAGVGAPRPDET